MALRTQNPKQDVAVDGQLTTGIEGSCQPLTVTSGLLVVQRIQLTPL